MRLSRMPADESEVARHIYISGKKIKQAMDRTEIGP